MNVTADTLLPTLVTAEVRDLAWACFSPALVDCASLRGSSGPVDNCQLALSPERRAWLQALDHAPAPLLAYLGASRDGRLGLYFERLWQFFLSQDPEVDLVGHNLPVHDNGRTLGEFDCIYFCQKRQCHVHLELAVKFYLQRPAADGSQWHHWVGPNVVDRLDRKLQRLLEHQLCLGDDNAARAMLDSRGIGPLLREMEIKGRLFTARGNPSRWPPGCKQDHPPSDYCELSTLPDCLSVNSTYCVLDRCDWFAPVIASSNRPRFAAQDLPDALAIAFDSSARPLQVARCDEAGVENERFFVVPPAWPSQALAA